MKPFRALRLALAGLAIQAFLANAAFARQRSFAVTDISLLKGIRNLEIAPNGSQAVYTVDAVGADGTRREQTIWLLDLKKGRAATRLTTGTTDTNPEWSPDGTRIAFLRGSAKADDPANRLVLLTVRDRKVATLVVSETGVTRFSWSPDGKSLAYSAPAHVDGDATVAIEPGVRIFTRANYRYSSYYRDFTRPVQVFAVTPGGMPRRLSNASQSTALVGWSADNRRVLYTVNETPEPYYGGGTSGLYAVGAAGGSRPERLLGLKDPTGRGDTASAPDFSLSPDGRSLAFVAGAPDQPGGFEQSDLFVLDLATGTTRNLTAALDEDVGDRIMWNGTGGLLATTQKEAAENIVAIDLATGSFTRETSGFQVVHAFDRAGGRTLAVISAPDAPAEIFDVAGSRRIRRSTVNAAVRDQVQVGPLETIWTTVRDGTRVEAFLQKPAGFDPARRYPLIVWNHGGPFGAWMASYMPDVKAMAGAGYLVLYPNPRGSRSYGQEFASPLARTWPGGPDYDDVLDVLDTVARRPYVDTARLAIAGSSAGGVMTDWAITHSDRFAAAVSISDIADFNKMWFIGDQPALQPGTKIPLGAYQGSRRSPLDAVEQVKTPTLFISGERDFRTPPSVGGELMFRALKTLRIPTALIRFETAGHSIYGSNFARHPELKMKYLIRWMDLHLRGTPAPEFNISPLGGDPIGPANPDR